MESILSSILPEKFNLSRQQVQELFEIVVDFRKKQISTFNEMKEKNIVSSQDKMVLQFIDNQQSLITEAASILLAVNIDCKTNDIPFYKALFNKGKGQKKNSEFINFYKEAIDDAVLAFKEKEKFIQNLFVQSTFVVKNNDQEIKDNSLNEIVNVLEKCSIELEKLLYIQDLFVNEMADLTIYELEQIKTNNDYQ